MEGFTLGLLGIALFARATYRRRRLPLTDIGVRCPENDCPATVTVRTDPAARTGAEYVEVVACSLLSDAATRLPAQMAYLAEAPSLPVQIAPAPSHPVYATTLPCGRACVHVLNEAAPSVARQPLDCTSGATDAIDLVRQAERRPRITRLLWYGGV